MCGVCIDRHFLASQMEKKSEISARRSRPFRLWEILWVAAPQRQISFPYVQVLGNEKLLFWHVDAQIGDQRLCHEWRAICDHCDYGCLEVGASGEHWDVPNGVQRFHYQDLEKATSGFSKENEIGSGGYGKVFVGTFADGKMLAIKRASATGSQGRAEFRNEVSATFIISLPSETPISPLQHDSNLSKHWRLRCI